VTLLNRLESRLQRFAIPGLIRYVVVFNALVYLLGAIDPGYVQMLTLDRAAILQGQVWRIVSWILIPDILSFPWILLYLYATWWVGDLLEAQWGAFRLNAYYFLGLFLCIVSAFVFGATMGNVLLNLSIFLALATVLPNLEILIFLIIPLKLKWAAILSLLSPMLILVTGPLSAKMMVIVCLANYFIFFGPRFFTNLRDRRRVVSRRAKFEADKLMVDTLHRCAVCGATEVSNPHLDFRVTSDGQEYCAEHLPRKTTQTAP